MASDCRIKYRKDILADSFKIAKERLSTIKRVSETKLIVPFFGTKLQKRDQAIMVSREVATKINSKFNANTFGAIAFPNSNPELEEGVEITLAVPSLLLDAYEVKYGQRDIQNIGKPGLQGKLFQETGKSEVIVESGVPSDLNYQNLLNLKPATELTQEDWDDLSQEEKDVIIYQAKNC